MGRPAVDALAQLEYIRTESRGLKIGDLTDASFPKDVSQIFSALKARIQNRPTTTETQVAAWAAVCTLTRDLEWIPQRTLEHINAIDRWVARIPRNKLGSPARRACDCAIAYGLGCNRTLVPASGVALNDMWPAARGWLQEEISSAVWKSMALARDIVPELRDEIIEVPAQKRQSDGKAFYGKIPSFLLPIETQIHQELWNWLFKPAVDQELEKEEAIDLLSHPDRLEIHSPHDLHQPLLPGQRRTFLLRTGEMKLFLANKNKKNGNDVEVQFVEWRPDEHLVVRVGDFGAATVRVISPRLANGYSEVKLSAYQFASLAAVEYCTFEALSCLCGRDTCSSKHRIEAFNPATLDAKVTLTSWIQTAIAGSMPDPVPHSFKEGMLYAWLSKGWNNGGCRLRVVDLVREQVRRDHQGVEATYRYTTGGVVLVGDGARGGPARFKQCLTQLPLEFIAGWRGPKPSNQTPEVYRRCGSLAPLDATECEFCGGKKFGGRPLTVWEHHGRDDETLDAVADALQDPTLNVEQARIEKEREVEAKGGDPSHLEWEVGEDEDS